MPAYTDEKGVDPERNTETFAQVTLWVDSRRWSGVPFVLRTGKALGCERREITVQFRGVPHTPFAGQPHAHNLVRVSLTPDQVSLRVNLNGPGSPGDLEEVDLQATLFVRGDEAEESWRIVAPIMRVWQEGGVKLVEYPAGSSGPRPPSSVARSDG